MNSQRYNNYGRFNQNSQPKQYYQNTMTSYGSNPPMFTEQELYAFEPAQQNIYQQQYEDVRIGDEEAMGGYMGQECVQPKGEYFGGFPTYTDYSAPRPSFSLTPDSMGSQYSGGSDFYSPARFAPSCESSPFMQQPPNRPQQNSFMSSSHPVSPVTPAGSPYNNVEGNYGILNPPNPAPSAFLLVPSMQDNSGQYQYSAYQVPMMPIDINSAPLPSSHSPLPQHPSPYTVCSSALASPSEPPALDNDDDDDKCILPNSGNKELRGMGLYDEPPELIYNDAGTPSGYSPITPHDQLRPTLGKGLVLEKSFGLPDTVMMKDEESGQIVQGHIEVDEDEESEYEESEYGDEPMIADNEHMEIAQYQHTNPVQQSCVNYNAGGYSNYIPVHW